MDKQQKITVFILTALLLVLLVAVVAVASRDTGSTIGDFVPPSFEENALAGMPEQPPAGFGTMTVTSEFVIGMCATPSFDGTNLGLYFTSPKTNAVWMKVRVCDENGRVLGESGLLKPGEHLPTLVLTDGPIANGRLYATVLSYEPDTYYSEGSVKVELKPSISG